MALELLGSRKRRAFFEDPVRVDVILLQFDASVTETHTASSEVTSFPVEVGADESDHIRRIPNEIEITGIVSNDPILILASLRKRAAVPGGDPDSRAEDAFRELNRIQDEGQLITVFTTLKEYRNMAITSISVPRDKDLGNAIEATVSMREIIKASSEEVVAPKEPVVAPRKAKVKKGKVSKKGLSGAGDRTLLLKLLF